MNAGTTGIIIKTAILAGILLIFNAIQGLDPTSVLFSLVVLVALVVMDALAWRAWRKKADRLAHLFADLTCGQKDLTIRTDFKGNDEFSVLGRQVNAFLDHLHHVLGQSLSTANQVSSAMAELAKSSAKMAAGTAEQNRQTSEIAAAVEELSKSIMEVESKTGEVTATAVKAADKAAAGKQNVAPAIEGLNKISDTMESSAVNMRELAERVSSIGQIVSLIKDVADQINLLALNAAIEAARAGEMGRGFAVVADEVKKLAGKASQATNDISHLIKSLQTTTQSTVGTMQHTLATTRETRESADRISTFLAEIVTTSQGVSNSIQEILVTAVAQQSAATTQMAGNMGNFATSIKETAKNTKKVSEASASTEKLADDLLQKVGGFKMNLLGVVPLENAVVMNRKFTPLAEYLGKCLGKELIIKVGRDYAEAIEDLGSGRVKLSYQTPTTYIEGKHRYGVKLLGYFVKDGSPTYRSAIVVAKASGIKTLAELRGKRFAFGSEKSTGSTLVPLGMLADAGITLKDLSRYAYLGSHDNVAAAILGGEYDAGGMMESVVADFSDKGITAIKVSEAIPQFPLCVSADIDPEEWETLRSSLLTLPDVAVIKAIDKGYQKFIEAKDSDFDVIRAMVKKLYNLDYR
jgi:phosphate/phosphite/phosphonate ABC transporter binding protein